jgi:hypothetical protein
MAEEKETPKVKVPGLEPVPFVVVKRADGTTVLRHPDELKKR